MAAVTAASRRGPDLTIPTGRRKGQNPSRAIIYRALAEHEKHEAYPEEVTHAGFATLRGEVPARGWPRRHQGGHEAT